MLRFAPFAIDVQRHVRRRGGETVDLSPRLVDILGHLASPSWSVISKEALLDRFWADVHVTDARSRYARRLRSESVHPIRGSEVSEVVAGHTVANTTLIVIERTHHRHFDDRSLVGLDGAGVHRRRRKV